MKFLWISRHTMVPSQWEDLQRIYGTDLSVTQYAHTLTTISQVASLVEQADVIGAVLPVELLHDLVVCASNKPVIYAKSQRLATGKTISLPSGETLPEFVFVHSGWHQIKTLCLETGLL